MATALDFRIGMIIIFDGELYTIEDYQHRTPGNKRGFVQAKMRNLKTGRGLEHKFSSSDKIDIARVERRPAQFLYRDNDAFHFMDQENHDQFHLEEKMMGGQSKFLKEGEIVEVETFENEVVGCQLPLNVALKVVETVPGIKGDTATGGAKPATLETGAVVQVPLFISENDVIKVDTRTGQYIERAKQLN
jgi:elongation factor P